MRTRGVVYGLVLAGFTLCSLYQGAMAVTCDSFTDEVLCEKTTTSSGKCAWQNGACATTGEGLGEGMFGITAITGGTETPGGETTETQTPGQVTEDKEKQGERQDTTYGTSSNTNLQENAASQHHMFLGTLVGFVFLLQLCV